MITLIIMCSENHELQLISVNYNNKAYHKREFHQIKSWSNYCGNIFINNFISKSTASVNQSIAKEIE